MSRKKEIPVEQKCIDLVNQLRQIREESEITTARLSEMTGIAQPNITRMETHKSKPGLETLLRIAGALGVEIKVV
jgi:transcriptional regulator with XRE-family HTH domain